MRRQRTKNRHPNQPSRDDAPLGSTRSTAEYHARTKRLLCVFRRVASLAMTLAFLIPSTAWSETEIVKDGRRTATGQKQHQSEINGIKIPPGDQTIAQPGRVRTTRGRSLRAAPRPDVSVGLIGCPGCWEVIDGVGVIVVDTPGRHTKSGSR
jgi:hypothetical protein